MRSYYFDTSIWLDYYLKRGENGEAARKLILKIVKEGDRIIYSDLTLRELKKLGIFESEINDMLRIAKPDNLKRVHSTKEQNAEADKFSKQRKIPFGDVIYAILARDHEAQLVSRDSDFQKIKDITSPKTPEELIQFYT